ncbi:MAG: phosphoribosylglycinamide formyltransferase [Phycisphaerae bacterium]
MSPTRIAILLSGGGRTMLNIGEEIAAGRLNASIALVISSREDLKGVDRAREMGIDVAVIRRKDLSSLELFSSAIEQKLTEYDIDLVVQAGWLCLWNIPHCYENRVLNIHPSLLPSFGGKGMWGHHVHEAVLARGCKVSGCTVHFCTNEYDDGPIILQRTCPAYSTDTPDELAARVFEQECLAYPEAIRLFCRGALRVENGIVHIDE